MPFTHHRHHRGGRFNLPGLFCFFICAGLVLIIAGISFLVVAPSLARELAVEAYNFAVKIWLEGGKFQEISDDNIRGKFLIHTDNNGAAALDHATASDKLKDRNPTEFLPYTQLYYSTSIPFPSASSPIRLEFPGNTIHLPDPPALVGGSFSPGEGDGIPWQMRAAVNKTLLGSCREANECDSYSIGSSSRSRCLSKQPCSSVCSQRNGNWSESLGACTLIYYAQKLCFLIEKQSDTTKWRLSESNLTDISTNATKSYYLASGKAGCYFESLRSLPWSGNGIPPNFPAVYGPSPPASLPIEMRSRYDPFVWASRLTGGIYDFGTSQGTKTAAGIALIIGGSVMILCSTHCLIFVLRCLKSGTNDGQTVTQWWKPSTYPAHNIPTSTAVIAATSPPVLYANSGTGSSNNNNPNIIQEPPPPYEPRPTAPQARPTYQPASSLTQLPRIPSLPQTDSAVN